MPRNRHHDSSEEEDEPRTEKRHRYSESIDIEDRLESLITRVGEKSSSSLESNLEGLAGVLEADLPNYKGKIIKILCDCIVLMPEKLTVYSTLVGLLNAKNYNAGGEFVEAVVRNLKDSLKNSDFGTAKILVRFMADLVNCHVVGASSFLTTYDNFIEVLLEDNIPQVRSDWYVLLVLNSLPWVCRELYEKKEPELNKMIQHIESYMRKRKKIHVPILRVWSNDAPHPQEEFLDCLWAQTLNLKEREWVEGHIYRPYQSFDSVLCDALQHSLPQIIPPSHHEDAVYPIPKVIFRMFDYTDVPESSGTILPGVHAIERWLIEEHIDNIVQINTLERKDCAAYLLNFSTKSKIPLNYMIVEVVFGQLFLLPLPTSIEIFFGSLLIELCKLQPSSMPQVLAQATEMIYERMDTMNTTCIERFVNWFSYHLNNFQFRWSWEDWEDCLTCDVDLPKPKVVKEVLTKCMRLSYHQRIVDTVPDTFKTLFPDKPCHIFKYGQEGAGNLPGTMVANSLMQSIKQKCSPEEVLILLREIPNPLTDDDAMQPVNHNPLMIDVFIQTILHLGSKSISHTFAGLAKFYYVFKILSDNDEGQMCILRSTYDVYRYNQQMMSIIIDKYLKTEIVECATVANWIFSPEMKHDFNKMYIWEIMHSTIDRMKKHVQKLKQELDEDRDYLDASKKKIKEEIDDDYQDGDVPTDAMIERKEEKFETAQSDQKNLFLIIFQRFIIILTDHLGRCESEGKEINIPSYKWVIERLQEVFLLHHEQVYKYSSTLEQLIFTSETDIHILQVFQQFCALRA